MAGVFKSLDQSDVRITPFRTYKLWNDSLGYTTYTAPLTSANQTKTLFSKLFGVGTVESRSAIYALSDSKQANPIDYMYNFSNSIPTMVGTGKLYKFEYQSDGTYNYVTDSYQGYSTFNITSPHYVATTTLADVPAIVACDDNKLIAGLRGDFTDAWNGSQVSIPSSSLAYQTLQVMDIGSRNGTTTLNVFLGLNRAGLFAIPVNISNFNLAGGAVAQPVSKVPYTGSYIGVLGSRTTAQRTMGLQIDLNDPYQPQLSPGSLRFIQWNGYTSTGSTYVTSSIIETTNRYDNGWYGTTDPNLTDTPSSIMEEHETCVYALMFDDRLYMIVTGSTTIAPRSTYIDGVAAIVATSCINKTTDLDGNPLPSRKVHIVMRNGLIILNPLPIKSGSAVVYNQSDIIDCRQYIGPNKVVKVVTNLRNTTNENIHIVAGPSLDNYSTYPVNETVAFTVNPNTKEVKDLHHFGSLKAHHLVTHGKDRDSVHASRKQNSGINSETYPMFPSYEFLYTSSLQGANSTKWYKFNM